MTEKILFVLPHQDDEMYIYHRIKALQKVGKQIFMVWMTDGAANNPEVRKLMAVRLFIPILANETDENIRRIRSEESTALAECIGITKENLTFCSFPSGQIKYYYPDIIGRFINNSVY